MGVKKILLKKFFVKDFFSSLNMYQAKSGTKNFSLYWGGGGGVPPKKVAQNELKHILVLEFLRFDDFVGGGVSLCEIQMYRQTHAIVTR